MGGGKRNRFRHRRACFGSGSVQRLYSGQQVRQRDEHPADEGYRYGLSKKPEYPLAEATGRSVVDPRSKSGIDDPAGKKDKHEHENGLSAESGELLLPLDLELAIP